MPLVPATGQPRITGTNRRLIFLHIPKTAGTTLNNIISRQYKSTEIYSIPPSTPIPKVIDDYNKLPDRTRAEIKVFRGHIGFGIHEFLPTPSAYITMLRDPVDRMISHYYHVLRDPTHYLYNTVISQRMSLKDYVESGISQELNNGQIRHLINMDRINTVVKLEDCSTEILEAAKKNVTQHFASIGISERFDENLILLKRAFGWRNIYYSKHNVSRNRPRKEDLSKDTIRSIEKHNELDIECYRYVTRLFIGLIDQGFSFHRELWAFKSVNQFFRKCHYRRDF